MKTIQDICGLLQDMIPATWGFRKIEISLDIDQYTVFATVEETTDIHDRTCEKIIWADIDLQESEEKITQFVCVIITEKMLIFYKDDFEENYAYPDILRMLRQ